MNAKPGSIITFTPFPNIEPYGVYSEGLLLILSSIHTS